MPKERSSAHRKHETESPASGEESGSKKRKTSSRASHVEDVPKVDEREKKSRRATTAGEHEGPKPEKRARMSTLAASPAPGKKAKKEGKSRASDAGVYHRHEDAAGKKARKDDGGKGRASEAGGSSSSSSRMPRESEAGGSSSSSAAAAGKAKKHSDKEGKKRAAEPRASLGGVPEGKEYAVGDAKHEWRTFHERVSPLLSETKRLQKLLEMAMDAETADVARVYTGEDKYVARAFEEVGNEFTLAFESYTVQKCKKEERTIRPAAARKEDDEPAKPNPVNVQRAAEEAKLREALRAFEEEEEEWRRVAESAGAAGAAGGEVFQALPAVGGPVASSHGVMQELSIADRNIICSREGEELGELLCWTKGFIDSGMDRVRGAVGKVQQRSSQCKELHSRLVGTLREATMAPYQGNQEPKKLLRSVMAGL